MPHSTQAATSTSITQAALRWSPALRRKTTVDNQFLAWLQQHAHRTINAAQLQSWFQELKEMQPHDEKLNALDELKRILRLLRDRVFFLQYLREVGHAADPMETARIMSHLATFCVQQSYQFIFQQFAQQHGAPVHPKTGEPLDLLLVAMGKWGGGELNVSSDIDFVVLYEYDGNTAGPRPLSHQEFYTRLTQRLLSVLSENTADGIVFRTDLRLRPDGDAGPLVWSLDGLHRYFLQQGREWERYAWIKAQPVYLRQTTYLRRAYERLESIRQPFVYRKYFDFNTLLPLRQLRDQIRKDWHQTVRRRSRLQEAQNIKIGEGGIREVEFVVQLNQLIRGGHSPSLQGANLELALKAQVQAQLLPAELAQQLWQAYLFLRQIEHLLQYAEDQQTHLLPQSEEALADIAHLMGYELNEFEKQLATHRQRISKAFKNAFRLAGLPSRNKDQAAPPLPKTPQTPHSQPAANTSTQAYPPAVSSLPVGSEDATLSSQEDAQHIQQEWLQLEAQFLRSQKARRLSPYHLERLKLLSQNFLITLQQDPYERELLPRIWRLLEQIAFRTVYVSLLLEYPETLERLCKIFSASPWAAQYLIQYPLVLNRLIEWEQLMQPIALKRIAQQLDQDLDACLLPNGQIDAEQQMNLMRDVQHQLVFQLLAQDLEGLFTVESLADQLSAVADLMLKQALRRTWLLVCERQPQLPAIPHFAIIAYGKLGGKELGYASDLDLVFLYQDQDKQMVEFYVRLARRLISWLSTLTSSGRLYDIDIRLRPDGEAGLIAVSMEAFAHYQKTKAWTWEHQAITRARFVAGDVDIGGQFERLRRNILKQHRNAATLKKHILAIRHKIAAGHPNTSPLFDIKHDRGGMVDVEFITQFLILRFSRKWPKLTQNLGNIALLHIAAQVGLLPLSLTQPAINSYRYYRRRQHELRLQGQSFARIEPQQALPHRKAVLDLWRYLFEN